MAPNYQHRHLSGHWQRPFDLETPAAAPNHRYPDTFLFRSIQSGVDGNQSMRWKPTEEIIHKHTANESNDYEWQEMSKWPQQE